MATDTNLIALIPALPLLGALINLLLGRRLARGLVHAIAIASVVSAFGVSMWLLIGKLIPLYQGGGTEIFLKQTVWTWMQFAVSGGGDPFTVGIDFRIDTLTAVMITVITFVGSLIHVFSTGYMAHEPRYAAYFGYLNLFTGAMLILVLGDNLPVMFIGWEGVGVCSYLLIGFWFDKEANADAGRKAFVVNRIGDFAFLLGICLLFWATGTLSFSDFASGEFAGTFKTAFVGGDRLAMAAGVLLFIGACGKSAQIPLYVWLPDAMAGPTPVSALIHAATMVTAGVYMVARLSFLYLHSTTAMAVVAGIGALTALLAAIMAFAQTDFKKVLAYSTVSQLGFMFAAVGVGAFTAGIFHLMTHAFFKAGLFLAAGSVMHAMSGSGDIMKMGALRRHLPVTHLCFLVYCLAIAGIFPFAGFFSKDEILAGVFAANADGWLPLYGKVLWATLTLAAVGTAFYMFRLYFLVFAGDQVRCDAETEAHIHESPWSMTGPLVVLALCTAVIGFLGLPHLTFIPHQWNLLFNWLQSSFMQADDPTLAGTILEHHASNAEILALMAVAMGLAMGSIFVAWRLYRRGPSSWVQRFSNGAGATPYRLSRDKFYVDEIYEKYILQPFRWKARLLFQVIDRFLIDTLFVNGSALVVDTFGRVARWLQNGQVQRYLVGIVIGTAAIFWLTSRSDVDFDYRLTGDSVEFVPLLGAGLAERGATVHFDLDFDGEADETLHPITPESKVTSRAFAVPGSYKVRMWVVDGVFGRRSEVVKNIELSILDPSENADGEAQ